MEPSEEVSEYTDWIEEVNADLNRLGLDLHEVARQPYRRWYESGLSPAEAAMRIMTDADAVGEVYLFDQIDDLPG